MYGNEDDEFEERGECPPGRVQLFIEDNIGTLAILVVVLVLKFGFGYTLYEIAWNSFKLFILYFILVRIYGAK